MRRHFWTAWPAGARAGVLIAAGVLVAGCVTFPDELDSVQRDVARLRTEFAGATRSQDAARGLLEERMTRLEATGPRRSPEGEDSRQPLSEDSRRNLNDRLNELLNEFRTMQGRLEQHTASLEDLQRRVDALDRQGRLTGPRSEGSPTPDRRSPVAAVPPPPAMPPSRPYVSEQPIPAQPRPAPAPVAAPPPPVTVPAPPPAPAAPPAAAPAPPAPAAPASVSSARASATLPPDELYRTALGDYTRGNYDLAITGFRSYMQSYAATGQAANAQYWLAESYYSQRNYKEALQEFAVVVRDYPESPKVPSSLFKQGEAYFQLNDSRQATAVLCELIAKHPKTREAQLARERNVRCR